MNENTVAIVQQSWAKLVPSADEVGLTFYHKLFELDPKIRLLFRGDTHSQAKKLMHMLSMAISKLRNIETLIPILHELGTRHIEYGVEASHYDTVAAALLNTLEETLGDDFTFELKSAWVDVFSLVAGTMIEAAEYSQTNVA